MTIPGYFSKSKGVREQNRFRKHWLTVWTFQHVYSRSIIVFVIINFLLSCYLRLPSVLNIQQCLSLRFKVMRKEGFAPHFNVLIHDFPGESE